MKTEAFSCFILYGLFVSVLLVAGCRTANDSERPWSQPIRDESILNMGSSTQTTPRPGSHYP